MMKKGAVATTTQGQLFVALGRLYGVRGVETGWYGIGFNGEHVVGANPTFHAENINAFLAQTCGET